MPSFAAPTLAAPAPPVISAPSIHIPILPPKTLTSTASTVSAKSNNAGRGYSEEERETILAALKALPGSGKSRKALCKELSLAMGRSVPGIESQMLHLERMDRIHRMIALSTATTLPPPPPPPPPQPPLPAAQAVVVKAEVVIVGKEKIEPTPVELTESGRETLCVSNNSSSSSSSNNSSGSSPHKKRRDRPTATAGDAEADPDCTGTSIKRRIKTEPPGASYDRDIEDMWAGPGLQQ